MSTERPQLGLTRRGMLAAIAGTAGFLAGANRPARAAQTDAVVHMRKIADELFAAARKGSPSAFLDAIKKHADIRAISEYCLGQYGERLNPKMRPRLLKGVAQFMAYYFADQAGKYQVERADILDEKPYDETSVVVSSRVYLTSGSSSAVDWLLAHQGRRYKVRDIRVLGLWLTPFHRRLFTKHIDKNGGDIRALLAALRV